MTWEPMNADGTQWRLMATSHAGFSVRAGIIERVELPWLRNKWAWRTGFGVTYSSPSLREAGQLVLHSARSKGYR